VKNSVTEKAISGFACTGLWPYNPDVFTDDDFLPSMITDEPEPDITSAQIGLIFFWSLHCYCWLNISTCCHIKCGSSK